MKDLPVRRVVIDDQHPRARDIGRFVYLLIVLNAWGAGPGHPADLSGDGVVGFDDLLIVLSAWTPM